MATEETQKPDICKVIVALDGSDHSDLVFDYYLQNVHRQDHTVYLVHAMDSTTMPVREDMVSIERLARKKTKDLEERFRQKMKDNQVWGMFEAELEKPSVYILQVAERRKPELIVVGAKGGSKAKRTILGSVCDHVVKHAKCSVLVVPEF